MNYEAELKTALSAAEKAGRVILELYARFKAIPDAPASISTDADKQSQAVILDSLHAAYPDDALCAEETTDLLADVPQTGPRQWIVDPIDGSRGFARKNGEFSVMVAFVIDGRIALGVVAEPALERLTYAVRGGGCWQKDTANSNPVRCRVSRANDLAAATLIQSHSSKGKPPSPQLAALKPARVVESYSAGIKLARVARGEVDLYLNNYPAFHDWDSCAGQVLVEEAGGRVTGLGGQELSYGLPGAKQTFGLLASNGAVHDAALQALLPTIS
jgi:3'(2'), 5'-bisphosphate nucleotidase